MSSSPTKEINSTIDPSSHQYKVIVSFLEKSSRPCSSLMVSRQTQLPLQLTTTILNKLFIQKKICKNTIEPLKSESIDLYYSIPQSIRCFKSSSELQSSIDAYFNSNASREEIDEYSLKGQKSVHSDSSPNSLENKENNTSKSVNTKNTLAQHKKRHIDLLHRYNESKDTGQFLLGRLGIIENKTTKQLYDEFDIDLND